ncbi:MAG: WD40/YVTN/BNR-like repeat-containing protein [Fastidiosipilaceae bacterium]|jgi:hypothetical protein
MNFRKRSFAVLISLTVLVLLVGAGILKVASLTAGSEAAFRFSIGETVDPNVREILTTGVNLTQIPNGNLLSNSSFEPYSYRAAKMVEVVEDDGLYISQDSLTHSQRDSALLSGASITVVGQDNQVQVTRLMSEIDDYSINHFAAGRRLQVPGVEAGDVMILDVTTRLDQQGEIVDSMAVGAHGLLMTDVHTQSPKIQELPDPFQDVVAVADSGDEFLVVTKGGGIYLSADLLSWRSAQHPVPENEGQWTDAVWFNNYFFIAGPTLYTLSSDGSLSSVSAIDNVHIQSFCEAHDSLYVVASEGVWRTTDGQRWDAVVMPFQTARLNASVDGKNVLALSRRGEIARSEDQGPFVLLDTVLAQRDVALDSVPRDPTPPAIDAVLIDDSSWMILDTTGTLYLTTDSGFSWRTSYSRPLLNFFELSPGLFLLSEEESGPALHTFHARISLRDHGVADHCLPGDICFIQQTGVGIEETDPDAPKMNPWQTKGEVTWLIDDEEMRKSGVGYLSLEAAENGASVRQDIPTQNLSHLSSTGLCLLTLQLRGDQLAVLSEQSPEFVLSGQFGEIKATTESLTDEWNRRVVTFLLPASLDLSPTIHFEIRWDGPGVIYLDQLYLGADRDRSQGVEADFIEKLSELNPRMIRLSALKLGTSETGSDSWSRPSGSRYQLIDDDGHWLEAPAVNLEEALRLTFAADGEPWLEISPHLNETQLLDICEYIAGPTSSTYGKARVESGSAVPWSHQFERIVFEFSDPEMIFPNDISRAGFVDRMIRTVESSPYYNLLKQKIVFVDGVDYAEDIMLSGADFHASDFESVISDGTLSNPTELRGQVNQFVTSIPRKIAGEGDSRGEAVRSFSTRLTEESVELPFEQSSELMSVELGSAVAIACTTLGQSAGNFLTDLNETDVSWAIPSIIGDLRGFEPLPVTLVRPLKQEGAEVYVFAFRDGARHKVIGVNLRDELVSIQLDMIGNYDVKSGTGYDASGHSYPLPIDSPTQQLQLLPGGVVVLDLNRKK